MSFHEIRVSLLFLMIGWTVPTPTAWLVRHVYKRVIDTEVKEIMYLHSKLKAMHQGHQAADIGVCDEGRCREL